MLYAAHRTAVVIMGDTGRSPTDSLDDFASFCFDTALSSGAAALPTLLTFAQPSHITFGSDWPFAPVAAGRYFAAGLETYKSMHHANLNAINRTTALALLPRLGATPSAVPQPRIDHIRHHLSRSTMRVIARLVNAT